MSFGLGRTGFVIVALLAFAPIAHAQVKPGDRITPDNAALVKDLVSPGVYVAVTKGMEINVIAPQAIDWPPPYQEATEKYASQVRLGSDHRSLIGYAAGQPFPLLDLNDPDIATKIVWNNEFRPLGTDDVDLRFYECQVEYTKLGGPQNMLDYSETGHLASYYNLGRTEVEPLPIDPDYKHTGIWWYEAAYPVISPASDRGGGGLRLRYWDPSRGDDAWSYSPDTRRLRRVNETILSSATGLSTWDPDHVGGFSAKPQEYDYKFLGVRQMLGCAHAAHSPERPCLSDGGATTCPEDWEMRRVYRDRNRSAPLANPRRAAIQDHLVCRHRDVVQPLRRQLRSPRRSLEDADLLAHVSRPSGPGRAGRDLSLQALVRGFSLEHRRSDRALYRLLSAGPRYARTRVLVYQHGRGESQLLPNRRDGPGGPLRSSLPRGC